MSARIFVIILFITYLLSPGVINAMSIDTYSSYGVDGGGNAWRVIGIEVSVLPQLIGIRVDSLYPAIYSGREWISLPFKVATDVKEVPTYYGTPIYVPDASKYLDKGMMLYIWIPRYTINTYTSGWCVEAAYNRLHERIYVKLRDGTSFYIFFDKNHTMDNYPYIITGSELEGLSIDLLSQDDIVDVRYAYHRSFVISRDMKRIIDYDLTEEECSKLYINMPQPPYYIDGGGGPSPPPQKEYSFFISLVNSTTVIDNRIAVFPIYVGAGGFEARLYFKLENPTTSQTYYTIAIDEIKNGEVVDSKSIYGELGPGESIEDNVVFYFTYSTTDIYRVNVSIGSPYIQIDYMYMIVYKDYSDVYSVDPTPETKYVRYGYDQCCPTGYLSDKLCKDAIFLGSNEFLLLTTPVINGYFRYGEGGYGLHISFKYKACEDYDLYIKVNGYPVKHVVLTGNYPFCSWQDVDIFIPGDTLADIVASALSSGIGLLITMESELFSAAGPDLCIKSINLTLPVAPDIWMPRSGSYNYFPHLGCQGSFNIHPDSYNLGGSVEYTASVTEYTRIDSYPPSDTYLVVVDVVASGVKEENNYRVLVEDVYLEISIPKNVFGPGLPSSPQYTIHLSGQSNEELGPYIESARNTYDIIGASHRNQPISAGTGDPYIGAVLYIVGHLIDILSSGLASVHVGYVDTDTYRTYSISWSGNLQSVEYGRFSYTFMLYRPGGIAREGTIHVRLKVETSAGRACTSFSVKIVPGETRSIIEPYVTYGGGMIR